MAILSFPAFLASSFRSFFLFLFLFLTTKKESRFGSLRSDLLRHFALVERLVDVEVVEHGVAELAAGGLVGEAEHVLAGILELEQEARDEAPVVDEVGDFAREEHEVALAQRRRRHVARRDEEEVVDRQPHNVRPDVDQVRAHKEQKAPHRQRVQPARRPEAVRAHQLQQQQPHQVLVRNARQIDRTAASARRCGNVVEG